MPSIPLHLPDPRRQLSSPDSANPLPGLLKTPSGLAILEIQGTLNVPSLRGLGMDVPLSDEHATNTSIGSLHFPAYSPTDEVDNLAWTKCVYLQVGRHQRLTGEVKKLQQPLAVVRRKTSTESDESQAVEIEAGKRRTMNEVLEIVEVVNWKIIFSQRPEPVGT